ncbi:MAG: hypothetical protein M3Y23_07605 [Actinomycetota bacterium]|nr:hypothetical protein [Actinomycetota bacterium]
MSLARASWIIVVAICAIASLGSFIAGYAGYGATVAAVGLAASVNLWPTAQGD